MIASYLLIPAVLLLLGLLWAEREQRPSRVLAFKAPLSALFVLSALLLPHAQSSYYYLVITGLVLGFIGDICLALKGDAPFKTGLVSFLLGHVAYVVAFAGLVSPGGWFRPGFLAICAVSGLAFLWLRPSLGKMLVPVLAYVVVITLMLLAAEAVVFNKALPRQGAWLIFGGALAFYLSDLCVARDRFKKPGWDNRLVGLPLYYGGQFAIAWSVSGMF
ncbi:MAG: lysoplasmalogenase [Desulfarculaceae bacterium]|nr:lysoplasmalogenase [Desulfarculaceae bacterium]MCF8065114.1 lysoplasmalogenase [Desulfarculaceae bacterium]MCF8099026.1 lysoplasmalogenase [Desulfarculaceae bacterium]MCF8123262.1 lysoplasmalogenase [Desulfarculaceae bacterium]